jgi:hypothetical protein
MHSGRWTDCRSSSASRGTVSLVRGLPGEGGARRADAVVLGSCGPRGLREVGVTGAAAIDGGPRRRTEGPHSAARAADVGHQDLLRSRIAQPSEALLSTSTKPLSARGCMSRSVLAQRAGSVPASEVCRRQPGLGQSRPSPQLRRLALIASRAVTRRRIHECRAAWLDGPSNARRRCAHSLPTSRSLTVRISASARTFKGPHIRPLGRRDSGRASGAQRRTRRSTPGRPDRAPASSRCRTAPAPRTGRSDPTARRRRPS